MILQSNLFFSIDEEHLNNLYNKIFPLHKLINYFVILQVWIGAINLFYLNNQILGLLEIVFFASIGIVTTYLQVPILYIIYSITSIIGCLIYFVNTKIRNTALSDLNIIISISGITNHFCCSILSLKIFLIIINNINWESKIMSIGGNLHITYIGYPRFNNSRSNIGHYTPLEEGLNNIGPKKLLSRTSESHI
ncbi:4 transmembrane domains [Cryptosporidium sp. chipmunk genotype I]|uniref:4 transmembrane domains n=1 Tax=Cryptosporidium sp. chipmunk genotype I TaxID=1280935 RepID=UPI003519F36F|nr:4 transmembrane domains [Cryptosporidium sp. chipmunk genotype I]